MEGTAAAGNPVARVAAVVEQNIVGPDEVDWHSAVVGTVAVEVRAEERLAVRMVVEHRVEQLAAELRAVEHRAHWVAAAHQDVVADTAVVRKVAVEPGPVDLEPVAAELVATEPGLTVLGSERKQLVDLPIAAGLACQFLGRGAHLRRPGQFLPHGSAPDPQVN